MSCSRSPLSELSKHCPPIFTSRSVKADGKDNSAPPSFRGLSSHPLSATLAAASALNTSENDAWAAFRTPRNQIEELPPLAAMGRWLPAPSASTFEAAFRPPSPCQYEMKDVPSSDDEESAYWNPEQETLHHLSSTAAALSSSGSPALYAPPRGKRYIYDFPSPDEAASLASTPATSCESGSASEVEGPADRNGQGKAHPLTMRPAADAAWDFERMFAKRRRRDGGCRLFDDEEEGAPSRSSSVGRGMDVDPSPVGAAKLESIAGISEEEAVEDERRAARQREMFETLRKVAMERLALLGAHLAWSGGRSMGDVGK